MKTLKLNSSQQHALNWAVIFALVVGFVMLRRYLAIIITATIAVYMFYPVFKWLNKITKRSGASAALTLIAVLFVAIIPLTLLVLVTIQQFSDAINNAIRYITSNDLGVVAQNSVNTVNSFVQRLSFGALKIDYDTIKDFFTTYGSSIASFFVNFLRSSLGSVPGIITNFILFIYVFTALLLHHQSIIGYLKALNPIGNEVSELYLSRAAAMTKGMVRGQFIIAFAQGMTGAFTLWIAGVEYFAPLALILSLLSIIPLGGGIVTIPIGIILALTGNFWGGIFVLAAHFLIVTNIDNLLRPVLVPKEARLNSALTMLAVFSGIALFGFLGLVIGPVLMILIVTTIDIFVKSKH